MQIKLVVVVSASGIIPVTKGKLKMCVSGFYNVAGYVPDYL